MADSGSTLSSEDKKSSVGKSRAGVFSRVINRLSIRRKSVNTDLRRSLRNATKSISLDNSVLNLEERSSQDKFLRDKGRLNRESSAPVLPEDRRQSTDYFSNFKHEGLYRGLLRTLLHPLGTPDQQIGFRPGDLIDHLQQVFGVDRDDHERYLRDEIRNKPRQLLLSVRVVEAKDLAVLSKIKDFKTYCLLQLTSVLKKSKTANLSTISKATKTSPKPSPKSSPLLKRSGSLKEKVLKTQLSKSTEQPYWNEEFHIKISEMLSDQLQIYIFSHETASEEKTEKTGTFRSFFKKQDSDKRLDVNIGHIVIPIRDIPIQGVDEWYDFYPIGNVNCKTKSVGKCHLQLSLSHVQGSQYLSLFSAEDYHQVSSQLHTHSLQTAQLEGKKEICLPEKCRRLLDVFCFANRISTLSQSIMDLTIVLELACGRYRELISDNVLYKALRNVQMTWMIKQVGDEAFTERMPLSDAEICVYRTATRHYISTVSERFDQLPCLFPPSIEHLTILKSKLGIVVDLMELDLWDSTSSPGPEITEKLTSKLQADIKKWLSGSIMSVSNHGFIKDAVIPECSSLINVIIELTSHCTQLGVVTQFYRSFRIKYYRIVILISENLLVKQLRYQMFEMDRYQMKYKQYSVNTSISTRLSLQLYFTVRKYYDVVKDYLEQRDLFRISFSEYQSWFSNTLIFWLQTFKTECMARVDKALEIDKDVVLVTSLVKFSNSSVDTLSCFAKITEEWGQIDYQNPDLAMMAVTKITDMICEGAGMYADRIHYLLERNCYYDCQEEQFDVNERLCITLNNIEHVRQYLDQLPELLNWDSVAEALSLKHENSLIGKQSIQTLHRLISSTQCDILLKSKYLLREIGNKMKVNIQQSMKNLSFHPEKPSSIYETLLYLSTNLETLNNRLMSSIYPIMLEDLWKVVLIIFNDQLRIGDTHEYYENMKIHFKSLSVFFVESGMTESLVKRGQYHVVTEKLELNSMSTEDLMLSYYDNVAQSVVTPDEYLGSLAVKIGYEEEIRDNIIIHVKVIQAVALPGLDSSGYSDPYVTLTIRPYTLVGSEKTKRTPIIYKTLDPTFNTDFTFTSIPQYYMKMKGAVIMFSVFDHDKFSADDFAGEIAIHLDSIPKLHVQTIDSVQVVMLPLKRPIKQTDGPFQVLSERQARDKTAKYFINERLRLITNQRQRTFKTKYKHQIFCGFLDL